MNLPSDRDVGNASVTCRERTLRDLPPIVVEWKLLASHNKAVLGIGGGGGGGSFLRERTTSYQRMCLRQAAEPLCFCYVDEYLEIVQPPAPPPELKTPSLVEQCKD